MWENMVKRIMDFEGSSDFLSELFSRISNEEDVESIICFLGNSKNCQKLLDFIRKHKETDANEVWQKAISIVG